MKRRSSVQKNSDDEIRTAWSPAEKIEPAVLDETCERGRLQQIESSGVGLSIAARAEVSAQACRAWPREESQNARYFEASSETLRAAASVLAVVVEMDALPSGVGCEDARAGLKDFTAENFSSWRASAIGTEAGRACLREWRRGSRYEILVMEPPPAICGLKDGLG